MIITWKQNDPYRYLSTRHVENISLIYIEWNIVMKSLHLFCLHYSLSAAGCCLSFFKIVIYVSVPVWIFYIFLLISLLSVYPGAWIQYIYWYAISVCICSIWLSRHCGTYWPIRCTCLYFCSFWVSRYCETHLPICWTCLYLVCMCMVYCIFSFC